MKDLTRDTQEVFTETEEISIFRKIIINNTVKYCLEYRETDLYIKRLKLEYNIYQRYKFEKLIIKNKIKET